MFRRHLTIAAIICLLLPGCGLMRGGLLPGASASGGCGQCSNSSCDGSCQSASGTVLPSPSSSCDCLVCQMVWQSRAQNEIVSESEFDVTPESGFEVTPEVPSKFVPELDAPLRDESWDENPPLDNSANSGIQNIVAEALGNCDCDTCLTLSDSRRHSIAYVDAEYELVDVALAVAPPPAPLPRPLEPMMVQSTDYRGHDRSVRPARGHDR